MKRTLATTALVIGTVLCLPVLAQQAPASPNAPNPSAPPLEGAGTTRNQPAASDMNPSGPGAKDAMKKSKPESKFGSDKASNTARSKKPREQGAPPAPTADAPSGPKGDSPDPAPKQ